MGHDSLYKNQLGDDFKSRYEVKIHMAERVRAPSVGDSKRFVTVANLEKSICGTPPSATNGRIAKSWSSVTCRQCLRIGRKI